MYQPLYKFEIGSRVTPDEKNFYKIDRWVKGVPHSVERYAVVVILVSVDGEEYFAHPLTQVKQVDDYV